jgi:hypothetical protein
VPVRKESNRGRCIRSPHLEYATDSHGPGRATSEKAKGGASSCPSASLLRPLNYDDVRALFHPFDDDHATVGRDVEVIDDDVATEIG